MPGAPAEKAGLQVGDKILEINGTSMVNERHDTAVQCIQKSIEILELIISREEYVLDNAELKKNIISKVNVKFIV